MQILYLRLSISRMNEIRLNYVQRFVNTFEDIILQIDSKILLYKSHTVESKSSTFLIHNFKIVFTTGWNGTLNSEHFIIQNFALF